MRFDDSNTFKREIKVEGFECDMSGRMRLSSVLREMQEIGNLHLEALGYPKAKMAELEMAFLLSKIYITVYKMPYEGQKLIMQTAPKKTKGIYFFRDINFYDENAQLLIEAHTSWVLVNTHENRHNVLRPKVFTMPYECDADTDYEFNSWKLDIDKDKNMSENKREIRFSDIDGNRHMNNAVYADIVYDCMPLELAENGEIDTFRICFKHEALLSDVIDIKSCEEECDGKRVFKIFAVRENEDTCFEAQVSFK